VPGTVLVIGLKERKKEKKKKPYGLCRSICVERGPRK
jgi:hypothetical protein